MKTCNKAKQRGDRHRTATAFYFDCIVDNDLTMSEAINLTWKYQVKYINLLETKTKDFGDDSVSDIGSCNDFYDEYIAFDYTLNKEEAVTLAWEYLDKYIKLLEGRLTYFRKNI